MRNHETRNERRNRTGERPSKKLARALALFLAFCITFTSSGFETLVYASETNPISQGEIGEKGAPTAETEENTNLLHITDIMQLEEDILVQTLKLDATEENIVFPDAITVTVNGKTNEITEQIPDEAENESIVDKEEEEEVPTETPTEEGNQSSEDTQSSEETKLPSESESISEEIGEPVEEIPESQESVQEAEGTETSYMSKGILVPILDVFQTTKVYAAENKDIAVEESITVPVTWELDKEQSTQEEFDATVPGAKYIYNPILPEKINDKDYILAEGLTLPTLTVLIEGAEEFDQAVTVDGITIRVIASTGVFPENAVLNASKITNEEVIQSYVEQLGSEEIPRDFYAFDVSILDEEGNEIQPDLAFGKPEVSFTKPEVEDREIDGWSVYHVNEETEEIETLGTVDADTAEDITVETDSFSPMLLAATASNITLYTGLGNIYLSGWTKQRDYVYKSSGNISTLPTPTAEDASLYFRGWYEDKHYGGSVTNNNAPASGKSYCAKWGRIRATQQSATMGIEYTYGGYPNPFGYVGSKKIQTTNNFGFQLNYAIDSNPTSSALINLTRQRDQLQDIFNSGFYKREDSLKDLKVAHVQTFEGNYVRNTIYMWNKGSTDINNFSTAVRVTPMVGDEYYLDVKTGTDSFGKYLYMTNSNNISTRIYYYGKTQEDQADSVEVCVYDESENTNFFNNTGTGHGKNREGLVVHFSWKNMKIPANSVVKRSYLVGCGTADNLLRGYSFRCDSNGNGAFDSGEEQLLAKNAVTTVPKAPTKSGYLFLGYNTKANGTGTYYKPGQTITITGALDLYAVFEQIKSTAKVTVNLDEAPWSGRQVALYAGGKEKYRLSATQTAGLYQNAEVINGTYDIYVDGKDTRVDLKVNATTDSVVVSSKIDFTKLTVTTKLNDQNSMVPGAVTLRDGSGKIVYSPASANGTYYAYVLPDEGSYNVFVAGVDTGFDVSRTGEKMAQIDFYTMRFAITDEKPWTDATVQLKDAAGSTRVTLKHIKTEENVTYFEDILQKSEDTLKVFVDSVYVNENMQAMTEKHDATATFYTAKAIITGGTRFNIHMTNGAESKSFAFMSDSDGIRTYEAKHVLKHVEENELDYTVTVEGTIDDEIYTINSSKKVFELTFHTVNFNNSRNSSPADNLGDEEIMIARTVYVRDGKAMPFYSGIVGRNGFAFDYWGDKVWIPEVKRDGNYTVPSPFDFTQAITKDIEIYACYTEPSVKINDILYTNANGAIGGNGQYYRMGNLTITGFESGDTIKYIYITPTNAEEVKFLPADSSLGTVSIAYDGASAHNGSRYVVSNGITTIKPYDTSEKQIKITFNPVVSMAVAQEYLRQNVIIKVKANNGHVIKVEAVDGRGEYIPVNVVDPVDLIAGLNGTDLGTKSNGATLSAGVYYLKSSKTFNGTNASTSNNSTPGLKVNGTVTIYIPEGVTLTVQGGHGYLNRPGSAGIEVPAGSTLNIIGKGTVKATGGNAGAGQGGSGGGNAYLIDKNGTKREGKSARYSDRDWDNVMTWANGAITYMVSGYGGKGGNGGGGAGAGIGTGGSTGGNGGAQKDGQRSSNMQGSTEWWKDMGWYYGQAGNPGNPASEPTAMGTFNASSTVTVTPQGGTTFTNGGGGAEGKYFAAIDNNWGEGARNAEPLYLAGSGGGGGGGGTGYAGANIGTGGYGGNGGGSGGNGGISYYRYYTSCTNDYTESYPGNGGAGGKGGNGSSGSKGNPTTNSQYGGAAGSGAQGGAGGTGKSKGTPSINYKINFDVSSSTTATGTYAEITYSSSAAKEITLPEYTNSNPAVNFLGWGIKKQAKNFSDSNAPFTVAGTRYASGQKVSILQGTYFDITLVAVTETLGGVSAHDTLEEYTYNGSGEEQTYYTYNITLKTDNVASDKGNIVIKKEGYEETVATLSASPDKVYSYITTDNANYDIYLLGEKIGSTAAVGEDNTSTTEIHYETMKVTVEGFGEEVKSFELGGESAPSLVSTGYTKADGGRSTETFQTERLKSDSGENISYPVIINGENTGKTVSFGTPVTVRFYTTTVNVNVTGFSADDITTVAIRNGGEQIYLAKTKDSTESKGIYTITKLENSDKSYTVYLEDDATNKNFSFTSDHTFELSLTRYATTVNTYVDGVLADRGNVTFNGKLMSMITTGVYQYISNQDIEGTLIIDGRTIDKTQLGIEKLSGNDNRIDFYTLDYLKSNEEEEGTTPVDDTLYLKGDKIILASPDNLINGGKKFTGWDIGGTTHQPSDEIEITGRIHAVATWNPTSLEEAAENFTVELVGTDFVYNGKSQVPTVKVMRGETVLTNTVDFEVKYANSNESDGRNNDADGSYLNAINAGTVTLSIVGIGDYSGTLTRTYEIAKKTIQVDNLTATDRVYDGTTTVEINTDDVILTGIVDGDEISLATAKTGQMHTPDAGENKTIDMSSIVLSGRSVSNYQLDTVDSITVNIEPKQISADMFTIDPVTYNGQPQEPVVSPTDKVIAVDGETLAETFADSFKIVDYSDNTHAGTGYVTITGDIVDEENSEDDIEGGEPDRLSVPNYKGTVKVPFTIQKQQINVTASNASSGYGEDIVDVSDKFTVEDGKPDELELEGYTTAKKGNPIGTYPISVRTENTDYALNVTKGTYSITQSTEKIPVVATGYTGVYDGKEHGIKVVLGVNDDTEAKIYYAESAEPLTSENYRTIGSTNAITKKDAGEYTIQYYVKSSLYGDNSGSVKITIKKADLVVQAKDHSVTYGDSLSAMKSLADSNSTTKKYVYDADGADYTASASDVLIKGWKSQEDALAANGTEVAFKSSRYTAGKSVGNYDIVPGMAEGVLSGDVFKNYDVVFNNGKLEVAPKAVTFDWSANGELTYTGKEQYVYAQIEGVREGDDVQPVYTGNAQTNAGENYEAKVTGLGGIHAGNYELAENEQTAAHTWKIDKASNEWTIKLSIPSNPFAKAKFGEVAYSYYTDPDCTILYDANNESAVPTEFELNTFYYIKAYVKGTDNYEGLETENDEKLVYIRRTYPGNYTVKIGDVSITYGDDFPDSSMINKEESASQSHLDDWNFTYLTDYNPGDPAGEYLICGQYVDIFGGDPTVEDVFQVTPGKLNVKPKPLDVIWSGETSKTYTGLTQGVTASIAEDQKVKSTDDVHIQYTSDSQNTAVEAGTYTAKVELVGADASNYVLNPETATKEWSIQKINLGNNPTEEELEAAHVFTSAPHLNDWYYGDEMPAPTAESSLGDVSFYYMKKSNPVVKWFKLLFNIYTEISEDEASQPKDPGEYWLVARVSNGGSSENDYIESAQSTFTIHPAQVVVSADNQYGKAGETIKDLTFTSTVTKGNLDADTLEKLNTKITLSTEANSASPVGTYPITGTTASYEDIADISYIDGEYQIDPNTITFEGSAQADAKFIEDKTVDYDAKPHTVSAKQITGSAKDNVKVYYSENELNANNYGSGTLTPPSFTDAGEHVVYYYICGEGYQPLNGSAKVTINKLPVTVTAKNTTIKYGEAAENDGVTTTGFIGQDSLESLELDLAYSYVKGSTSFTESFPQGVYDIVPSSSNDDSYVNGLNYSFTFKNGMMTVEAIPLYGDKDPSDMTPEQENALFDSLFDISGIPVDGYVYDGTEKTPAVTPKDGFDFKPGVDYEVTYINNINAGENTAKIIITAKDTGNYSGKIERTFSIKKKPITVLAKGDGATYSSKYNEEIVPLSYKVTNGSFVSDDEFKMNLRAYTTLKKGSAVGQYENGVTVRWDTNGTPAKNYAITVENAMYTITPSDSMDITVQNYVGIYDGNEHSGKVTAKTGKLFVTPTIYYSDGTELTAGNLSEELTTLPKFTDVGEHIIYYYVYCANYAPKTGHFSVNITPKELTVTVPDKSITYGDNPTGEMGVVSDLRFDDLTFDGFVFSEGKSLLNATGITFETNYAQYRDAGTYKISVDGLTAQNYTFRYVDGKLTVNKKNVSFVWNDKNTFEYNGQLQYYPATVNPEDIVNNDHVVVTNYVDCELPILRDRTYAASDVGKYKSIVESLGGAKGDNYTFAENEPTKSADWEIIKVENKFLTDPTMGPVRVGPEGDIPDLGPIVISKFPVDGDPAPVTPVYTYYNLDESKGDEEYGDSDKTTEADNGAPTPGGQPTKPGKYRVKVRIPGTDNYDPVETFFDFVILDKEDSTKIVYVTVENPTAVTYGDTAPSFSVKYEVEGADNVRTSIDTNQLGDYFDNTEDIAYQTEYTAGSIAGSYPVTAAGLTSKDGYVICYEPNTLEVNRKPIALQWQLDGVNDKNEVVYDSKSHIANAYIASDLVGSDALIVTVTDNRSNMDANSYDATASVTGTRAASCYAVSNPTFSYRITKAGVGQGNEFTKPLTISGWTYGDTENDPVAESKYGEVVFEYYTDEGCNFKTSAGEGASTKGGKPKYPGTYFVKAIVAGGDNFDDIFEVKAITIAKRPLSVIAKDVSGKYGTLESLDSAYDISGTILEGDQVTIQLNTTATAASPIGEYPITVNISGEDKDKYDITTQNGIYNVCGDEASVSVTASGYIGYYDGSEHGITVELQKANEAVNLDLCKVYYSTEHAITEENYLTGHTENPLFTDAGTYDVYYYVDSKAYIDPNADSEENRSFSGKKTVTIQKVDVAVTVDNAEITYGETAPSEGKVRSTGFVNNETLAKLGITPIVNFNYTQYANVAATEITCTNLEAKNYNFTVTPGTLTINPAKVTFAWFDGAFDYNGKLQEETAVVRGLLNNDKVTVTYESNPESHITNQAMDVGEYVAKIASLVGEKAARYYIEENESTRSKNWSISAGSNRFIKDLTMSDWTYGDTMVEPYAESLMGDVVYEYSDVVYVDDVRIDVRNYSEEAPTTPGEYNVRARVDGTDAYGMIISTPIGFKIDKAPINITVDNKFASTQANSFEELTYTLSGNVVANDPIGVELSIRKPVGEETIPLHEAKSYDIDTKITYMVNGEKVVLGADEEFDAANCNYEITVDNGKYNITSMDISVDAKITEDNSADTTGGTLTYDGKYHGVDVQVTKADGSAFEDEYRIYYSRTPLTETQIEEKAYLELDTTSPTRRDVGTLSVYYYVVTGDNVFSGQKNIVINKARLKVIANDHSIWYGEPAMNGGVTYEGFAEGETEAKLSGNLMYEYTYNIGDKVDLYEIIPYGLSSSSYDIEYVSGTLRVKRSTSALEVIFKDGTEPSVHTYHSLEEALDALHRRGNNGTIKVTGSPVVVEKGEYDNIPHGVTLIVPSGQQLEIDGGGTIHVKEGGSLIVEDGGKLSIKPDGKLIIDGTVDNSGEVENEGTIDIPANEPDRDNGGVFKNYPGTTTNKPGGSIHVGPGGTFETDPEGEESAGKFVEEEGSSFVVGTRVSVTEQPSDVTATIGETATFKVTATGSEPKYQWFVDRNDGNGFVEIAGANEAAYTTDVLSLDKDGYKFKCRVTNRYGYAETDEAVLTVAKIKPTAPEKPVLIDRTDTTLTVEAEPGIEYSLDGIHWNTTGIFTDLIIDTPYIIYARKQATDNELCSDPSTLEVRTRSHDEKAFDEYKKQKIEETKNRQLEKDLPVIEELIQEAIKAITEIEYDPEKSLDENKAGIDDIVSKSKEDIKKEWQKVPTGLDKIDPSKRSVSDGKITGVDDTMEYSTDGGNTWKAVEPGQTEIIGLPVGEIKIRRKAIPEDRPAGESITFILETRVDGIYQVTYHVDGDVKVVVDDAVYVKGSVAHVLFTPVPEKEGHIFLGWSEFSIATKPTYTVDGAATITFGDEDVDLYAVWRKAEIEFAKEPVIIEDLKSIEINKGDEAELTILAKSVDDGELSYAWYYCDTPYEYPHGQLIEGATENTLKVPTDIGKASYYYVVVTNAKGDETAHVISKLAFVYVEDKDAHHFKVDFIINEDEICISYDDVIDNALISEPSEPDVAGFAGWYRDPEGTEKWNFAKDTVTADIKLYAKQVSTVYVTYSANGGQFVEGTPQPVSVAVGSKLTEPDFTLVNKNHMVFSGWFKDIYATDAWDFTVDRVNKNLTLYAGWGYPAGIEEEPELSVCKVGDYIYTGKQIKPVVTVSYGGRVLVRNVDYTVSYKNNVKVYTGIESNNLVVQEDGSIDYSKVDSKKAPTIIIKGKRNYSKKSIQLNFNIVPINLGTKGTTMMDACVASDFTTKYEVNNKSAIKVKGKVTYDKKKLKAGKDYTLTLATVDTKNKAGAVIPAGTELSGQKIPKGYSGTFRLTVEGKDNYSGGFYKIITVMSDTKTLQKAKISLKKITYSGKDLTVEDLLGTENGKGKLAVKVKGKTLTYGTDYTVSFAEKNMKPGSRTNGGVYPITITGKGDYDGSRMTNAVITGMPIKKATVTLKDAKPEYTGSHIGNNIDKVTVTGPDNTTKTLYAGIDYDAKVTNDIKAGTAKVTITGKGIYAGTKKVTYKIQKKSITTDMVKSHTVKDGVVDLGNYAYFNGYAVQPKIGLEYNDMTLIRPTDYAMTYTNNKKAGSKATATIKGRGNYTGTIKATFTIGENAIDGEKISIKKAKVKVNNQVYTGREITLNQDSFKIIKIKVGKTYQNLVLGKDFEIVEESYRNNVDVTKSSLARVTIHGIGEKFDGYKSINFKITKKDLKWWESKKN